MRLSDLTKDKAVKEIAVDNIDESEIQVVSEIKESKGKMIWSTFKSAALISLILTLVLVCAYTFVNDKFVQGDVAGAKFSFAGISLVGNDYDPDSYIKPGSIVYYDGAEPGFLNLASSFKAAKVVSSNEKKVEINGDKPGKTVSINKAQVRYVIE